MINETNYWNLRYAQGGNSGNGSYGLAGNRKLKYLEKLDFETVTEIGCGDFNFGNNLVDLHPVKSYVGYDISEVIIAKNRALYPQHTFKVWNRINSFSIREADLLLCVDVLFHILDDREADEMLMHLKNTWTKYLVITAYERDEEMEGHVRIRKFDPAYFGVPIVREVIEEDGQLYFYIFKK